MKFESVNWKRTIIILSFAFLILLYPYVENYFTPQKLVYFSDVRWVVTYNNETYSFDTYEDFIEFKDCLTRMEYERQILKQPSFNESDWEVWIYRGTNETKEVK